MAIKVSVIIPALNAAAFVGGAIGSALGQTLSNLEVIVVDDGSTDDTAAIVRGFMAQDPRVRLIAHAAPRGVSAARNTALAASVGEWIALLDADDEFAPSRLDHLVAEAQARGLDALADNLQLVDFATRTPLGLAFPEAWMTTGQALTLQTLLDKDTPGNHDFRPLGFIKPILRRERLQKLDIQYAEDITFAEDFLLYAELVMAGFRMGLTPAPTYIYAVRPGSVSNKSTIRQTKDTEALLEVNRRLLQRYTQALSQAGISEDADIGDLRSDIRRREQAIKYCRVVNLAKADHVIAALSAVRHVELSYLVEKLSTALRRRLARPTGRSVS
jgi:glycosyltransferase involved in cell wall biosynthesis